MPSSPLPSSSSAFHNFRHLLLFFCTICLSLLIANSLAFKFTVICMTKSNGTTAKDVPMFSVSEQGWLFTAVPVGRLLGTPFISFFISRFGFRNTFTGYGLISIFSMLLVPFGVNFSGFHGLFLLQILQGVAFSVGWSAAGAITYAWSPPTSYGLFLATLTCNYQFGPMLVMPLAAAMCTSEHWSWSAVYYTLGLATLIFFAIFYAFYRNWPREQRFVTAREIAIIEQGKGLCNSTSAEKNQPVPYKSILRDPVIFGQICAHTTRNIGFMILLEYAPIYFNKALGVQIAKTGIAAAFPSMLAVLVKFMAGPISDRANCVSEKFRVVALVSSQYLAALCFLGVALFPLFGVHNVLLLECFFTGANVFSALSSFALAKNTQLVSRQFSHVVFTWQILLSYSLYLFVPLGIILLAPNNSIDEWALVFALLGLAIAAGTIVYNLTAEVGPRPWTLMARNDNEEEQTEQSGEEEEPARD